jgi:ribosomal protein S18 acetylase RimI-like enzyme
MFEDRSQMSCPNEAAALPRAGNVSETREDEAGLYFPDISESAVHLEPASAKHDAFMYATFASTRIDELAITGWTEEQKEHFLRMQFEAQRQSYLVQTPEAEYSVICCGETSVGRLILERTATELHIVDIALLPQFRKQGIGSYLMKEILSEAAGTNKSVRLFVERFNPALRWYEQLGFRAVNGGPIYLEMVWQPACKNSEDNKAGVEPALVVGTRNVSD